VVKILCLKRSAIAWGRAFHDQTYLSQAAMTLIAERGGTD